jgi:hypothetical protein
MPQLLLLAAVGIGAYAGYRWLRAKVRDDALKQGRAAAKRATPSDAAREAGDLVRDEKTGVYRPRS